MKTPLEVYLEHGIDLENRRIFFQGDVDENSVARVIKALFAMGSSKPIQIVISSCGGCDDSMFALYDVIQSMETEVKTIAHGGVYSAAVLLAACGDVRVAYPNTAWMVHETSIGEEGKVPEVRKYVDWMESRTRTWCELMAQHSKLNIGQWRRMISKNHDVYFGADQALEYGIIDEVIGQ